MDGQSVIQFNLLFIKLLYVCKTAATIDIDIAVNMEALVKRSKHFKGS